MIIKKTKRASRKPYRVGKQFIILITMKVKKLFTISAAALLMMFCFSSCGTTSQFSMAAYRPVTGVGVLNVPTLADLEVSQTKIFEKLKVEVKAKLIANDPKLIENAVNAALSELLLKRNADVLIQPVLHVERSDGKYTTSLTITVSGYPAIYKNFRTMIREDAVLFKDINIHHIPNGVVVSEQNNETIKKKR